MTALLYWGIVGLTVTGACFLIERALERMGL